MTQSRRVPLPRGRAAFRDEIVIPKRLPRLSNVEITEKSKEVCPDCGRRMFKALRTANRDWAYVGHDAFTFCVNNECNWNVPDSMFKKLWNPYFQEPILKCGDCGLQTLTIDSVNDTHVMFRCQRRFIQAVRRSQGGELSGTIIVGVKGDLNDEGIVRICSGRYQRALTALNGSLCQELWKLPSQVDRLSVSSCLHLVTFLELKDAVFEHASLQDQAHQVLSSIQRSPALAQAFDDLEHQV